MSECCSTCSQRGVLEKNRTSLLQNLKMHLPSLILCSIVSQFFHSFNPYQVSVLWTGTPSTTCCHVTGLEMLLSLLWEEQQSLCSALQEWIQSPWRTGKALWGWLCRKGELPAPHSDTTRARATKHNLDGYLLWHTNVFLGAAESQYTL